MGDEVEGCDWRARMSSIERDKLEVWWGSSAEEDAGERCAVAVVVAAREVRVRDEGQPTLGHAFEAEKRLYWDTDEDLCHNVVVAADRLSRCRGIVLRIGGRHSSSPDFHQTRWLREKRKSKAFLPRRITSLYPLSFYVHKIPLRITGVSQKFQNKVAFFWWFPWEWIKNKAMGKVPVWVEQAEGPS